MSASFEIALALANDGYRVFPLEPNSKFPAIVAWQINATTDPETIHRWWHCPVMGWPANYGVGVATGKGLLVIDIDVKHGGLENLKILEDTLGALPRDLAVRTPSGGLHIYLKCEGPIANSASKLAPGIDTRGDGGYVVGPGTRIDEIAYEVLK